MTSEEKFPEEKIKLVMGRKRLLFWISADIMNANEKTILWGDAMKLSKLAAGLFAALGTVLLVGSVAMCMIGQAEPSQSIQPPEDAKRCAQEVLDAIDDGDLNGAGRCLYGQPELGLEREPETAAGRRLWNAYRDSLFVEAADGCYTKGYEIFRDAAVTALDIPGVLERQSSRAAALLKEKLEQAEDPAQLLTEDGSVPEVLREDMLTQALTEVLTEQEPTVTRKVTLKLVNQGGQWWVVPDAALLEVLSGGLD